MSKPGDAFTAAWVKRGEELLAMRNAGEALSLDEQRELEHLDQLAESLQRTAPERADDPKTWFVDESRRPQLDGSDFLTVEQRRELDGVCAVLEGIVVRYGPAVVGALFARVLTKR